MTIAQYSFELRVLSTPSKIVGGAAPPLPPSMSEVLCDRGSVIVSTDERRIEDMHAILFERKMISGAALPKKVDGERLSKIYENSI